MSKIIKIKNTITSIELMDLINKFRIEENDTRVLRHDNLVRMIKDEFTDEKGILMVKDTPYIHPQNKQTYYFYELDFYQSLQLLMKESRIVRQKVIEYIKKLEKENMELRQALWNKQNTEWLETRKQGKLVRRDETDVIASLIIMAKKQGSKNADKLYMVYSSLVNKLVGIKSKQRDIVSVETLEHIRLLEDLISKVIANGIENDTYYKNIYQNCKEKANELIGLLTLKTNLLDGE